MRETKLSHGAIPAEIRIRRAQRRDFAAVAELCARLSAGKLEENRHTLRRFRRIVADLGNDLYLADNNGHLSGLLHLHFTRQLLGPPRAEVSLLLADPGGPSELASRLLDFALARARRRLCASIVLAANDAMANLHDHLLRHGFQRGGEWYVCFLGPNDPQPDGKE